MHLPLMMHNFSEKSARKMHPLKTRGIKYSHVEIWLLFAPHYQNFWLRAWSWVFIAGQHA